MEEPQQKVYTPSPLQRIHARDAIGKTIRKVELTTIEGTRKTVSCDERSTSTGEGGVYESNLTIEFTDDTFIDVDLARFGAAPNLF